MFPIAGGLGYMSNRAADAVDSVASELVEGVVPQVTTMKDAKGNTIAWLYDQRRFEVPSDKIAPIMKMAIVSIEDRRFLQHAGVDWQGTLTGLIGFANGGSTDTRGGSTIDQQYVKNYQLLVLAHTDAERRAAIETTPARKIREIRMALTLDKKLSKDEILTRYLNLVPFGNGAYGIENAAQTYFGVSAADLNVTQSAMLAGMVQSSSKLNPYTNPQGVLERRNTVLDTMITNIPERADEFRAAKARPLGVLKEPNTLPQGCIAAKDEGFFCDYAMTYLEAAGISRDQINKGGFLIRTSLDPDVQKSSKAAIDKYADPELENIAEVMSIIAPGQDSHKVVAMASSRTYGLDGDNHETVQPQPYSMVGDGAGSIFKLFTTAAAMEKGLGTSAYLDVPGRVNVLGMGHGGAPGCPANYYCVQNAGNYKSPMTVTEALATSPNTAFVRLIQQTGVTPTVDMAVRLGLRAYTMPGSSGFGDQSLADMVKEQNLGSFTLGPTSVNPLELSNVAATLASHGKWCPPSPILDIVDRNGKNIPLTEQPCQQVVEPGLADSLANAMSKDDQGNGTSAGAARATGWSWPVAAKTGTTETNRSSAFLAFTDKLAGAAYIYGDSPTPGQICSFPLRSCWDGNLFGGQEPAMTWYTAIGGVMDKYGPTSLPDPDPKYVRGSMNAQVPDVAGLSRSAAEATLRSAGFEPDAQYVTGTSPYGTAIGTSPSGSAVPGTTIVLLLSDGSQRYTAPPQSSGDNPGDNPDPIPTRRRPNIRVN